jgi:hypothetical protein
MRVARETGVLHASCGNRPQGEQEMSLFIEKLTTTPEGRRALDYHKRKWTLPADGPEMEAWNKAFIQALQEATTIEETLSVLSAGPLSYKTHRNALFYTPGYTAAYEAKLEALKRLPDDIVRVLRDDLRYAAYRARVSPQEQVVENHVVRLVRPTFKHAVEISDQWYLEVPQQTHNAIGAWTSAEKLTHPVYLRTGHLSAKQLSLETAVWPTADEKHVLSVLVKTARDRAFACEVVFEAGRRGRFSAWRELEPLGIRDALLPHIGRVVRLGDVVIGAHTPVGCLSPCSQPHYLERVNFPPGKFVTAPTNTAVFFQPETPTYFIKLSHPDHYTVEVHLDTTQVLHIAQVPGRTQYIPPERGGD